MSEQPEKAPEKGERRRNSSGITSGGRRQADQASGKASKRWFIASMLLTAGIMAWTFTLPFRNRTEAPLISWQSDKQDKAAHAGAPADPQYQSLRDEQYVNELKQIEDDLQAELRKKEEERFKGPTKREVRAKLKHFAKDMYEESQELLKSTKGNPRKGTVQWERLKELKEMSEDLQTTNELQ